MLIDQVERTKLGQEQKVGSPDGTDNEYHMSLAPCF